MRQAKRTHQKMKNSGAIVYWIDKAFCVQSTTIAPYELKAGATYESEATWKTGDAEHSEVILIARAGNPSEKERVKRLKQKAKELQEAVTGKAGA